MKRSFLSIFILFLGIQAFAQHAVQFAISSLPLNTVPDSGIFLAGSFNGWNPRDENYRLQKDASGRLMLGTKLDDGSYEYKITRGSWDRVECKKGGGDIPNRSLKLGSDTIISIAVDEWSDRVEKKPRMSTASKNVMILDTAFLMPQLDRTRRVWIYLPPGYNQSRKSYPVLYMQDGQNVFDEKTSFSGEWGVDETLDSIGGFRKELIVVAVDHGGSKRINEYCPYDMEKYGPGEGNQYLDFLVNDLKPFIDRKFRTQKTKKHTFIAGSSMGGLISMYALLKYPKVFGGAGVFSPAFWIAPRIFDDIKTMGSAVKSKIYFYCGGAEGATMQSDMERAFEEMRKVSKSPMITCIRPDGKHTESVWKDEFPLFYLWLMEK